MSALEAAPRLGALAAQDIDVLLAWVIDAATPAELTWHANEFSAVRDWLKAHKAAVDLRVKATRVELIALRKIGQAGLAKKLNTNQRLVADWLAEADDEAFAALLAELSATATPIGLYRASVRESEVVRTALRRSFYQGGNTIDGFDGYRAHGLNDAVRVVLDELALEGESFTIAKAADRLETALIDQNVALPTDFAEPLRQAVRHAIAVGAMSAQPYLDANGERVRVPQYITYSEADEGGYVRVPWTSASLEQLRIAVAIRQHQLAMYAERFEQTTRLLRVLEEMAEQYPDDSADQLLVAAIQQNRLVPDESP